MNGNNLSSSLSAPVQISTYDIFYWEQIVSRFSVKLGVPQIWADARIWSHPSSQVPFTNDNGAFSKNLKTYNKDSAQEAYYYSEIVSGEKLAFS